MSRRSARKHAFVLVFEYEFYTDFDLDEAMGYYLEDMKAGPTDKEFIYTLSHGTLQNLGQIDDLVSGNLSGWQIDRLNKVDLAIVRLGVYEMLYASDIPRSVTINEAVELAKVYGTDDSFGFVNGLLGKISTIIGKE